MTQGHWCHWLFLPQQRLPGGHFIPGCRRRAAFSAGKESSSSHISAGKRSFYTEILEGKKKQTTNFYAVSLAVALKPHPSLSLALLSIQTPLHLVGVCSKVPPPGAQGPLRDQSSETRWGLHGEGSRPAVAQASPSCRGQGMQAAKLQILFLLQHPQMLWVGLEDAHKSWQSQSRN